MAKIFIILILIFNISAVYALDANLWNMPLPDSTRMVYQDKTTQINDISAQTTHLVSQLSPEELTNFYKGILLKSGWQLKEYFPQQNISVFINGDQFFYVGIQDNGKDIARDVYLVSSPGNLALCQLLSEYFLKEEMREDVPGKDFVDIPRYPGAKRRMNISVPDQGKVLLYEAEAKPAEISQFYQKMLKMNGWQICPGLDLNRMRSSIPDAGDMEILLFNKDNNSLVINIYSLVEEGKKRSMITITNNAEEIVSFEKE